MLAGKLSAFFLVLGAVFAPSHALAAPKRVVSMNLCADQLAMLVAGEDQLISVSYLTTDPNNSPMAEAAAQYQINHGLAEEIYLMKPDLVLVGSFTNSTTVEMLKRLDIPVEVIEPAYSLADVSARLLQLGALLGQEPKAQALAADYDRALAEFSGYDGPRPSAALYAANGYTSGDATLAGQILTMAGFENAATKAGYGAGGFMPLEHLAVLDPDAIITSTPYAGASRAEDILTHPVVETLRQKQAVAAFTDRDWVCGTPAILDAIARMVAFRQSIVEGAGK